ncbi:hypothetical protein DFH09DRAFT_1400905 [Mycena vulgaris]|nr:hypothetical protein DFH09DRAFT_1400905 [Mycena vulgaris]
MSYQPILPPELWLACWTLCSTRQLRRVSRVCHLFRALCLPLLFENQCFDAMALLREMDHSNWMDRARRLHRTAVRLERLADGPQVLTVRSCTFSIRASTVVRLPTTAENLQLVNRTYQRISTTISTTLGLYLNLRSLAIGHLTIDCAFRSTLSTLLRLEELSLQECDIVDRQGVLMKLGTFTISDARPPFPKSETDGPSLQLVSSQHIGTLNIHSTREAVSLIKGFGPAHLPHLVHLSLDPAVNAEILFRLLNQCPRLETLTIKSILRTMDSSSPELIHPGTIPLLRNITAPLAVIRLFTPNRPVSAVTVVGERAPSNGLIKAAGVPIGDLMLGLLDVAQASTSLRSLVIPRTSPSLESFATIASLFPELQQLSINITDNDDTDFERSVVRLSRRSGEIDTRTIELCDDEAFDDLSEDELSEDEEAPPPTVVFFKPSAWPEPPASNPLHTAFHWICSGAVALPQSLEVLRLRFAPETGNFSHCPSEQQHQTMAALSRLYPVLREVEMGHRLFTWQRNRALWKGGEEWRGDEEASYLQIIS